MGTAAIPNYIRQAAGDHPFDTAPPGHRFYLYFEGWRADDWMLDKNQKTAALKRVFSNTPPDCKTLGDNLRERQQRLANKLGDSCLTLPAKSTSPFATGLGLEHPVENGFSFLNPYGLAYLPGSGVKGVLRRAAEELALLHEGGWTLLDVWWLFGFDASAAYLANGMQAGPDSIGQARDAWREAYQAHVPRLLEREDLSAFFKATGQKAEKATDLMLADLPDNRSKIHLCGALGFWDVIPSANQLAIDIMTPHYSDYYQGNSTPHDAGQPTPIPFLVVPPGSEFVFHAVFEPRSVLPDSLQKHWRGLLQEAFEHAFDWLGFGAKTAVGYGVFEEDESATENMRKKALAEANKAEEDRRLQDLPPIEREMDEAIKSDPDSQKKDYLKLLLALKNGRWQGGDSLAVAKRIEQEMRNAKTWKEQSAKKDPSKDKDYQTTLHVKKFLGLPQTP